MIALAATLHDTSGVLAADAARLLGTLRSVYPGGIWVATSPPTHAAVVEVLVAADVHAGAPKANQRGPLYRLALRAALTGGAAYVHYLDFDRVLHWMDTRPDELPRVLRVAARHAALVVGRTARAHRSHHRPLHVTETIANRVLADRLGWTGRVDLLVPSFVLDRERVTRVVRSSRVRGDAIYGELAGLIVSSAPRVAYIECRGLEWETPNRDRAGVAAIGLDAWRDAHDTPGEWRLRSRMAEAIVRGFERALPRRPARPELIRLEPRQSNAVP